MSLTLEDTILIECTTFAAALYEPLRDPMADYWAATWVLRKGFNEKGLPYRGPGTKDAERALKRLADDDLIVRRRGAHKTVGIHPTLAGQQRVWRLLGEDPGDALDVLREVARLGPGGEWVLETNFTGGATDPESLKATQHYHEAALVAQWVETNCDCQGRVGYKVTAVGFKVLEADPGGDDDEGPVEAPEADEEAVAIYLRAYKESIAWLNSQDEVSVGARGELGNIPLPMSAWAGTYKGTMPTGGAAG